VPSTWMATVVALGADLDGQMTCKFSSAKERRGCGYTLLRSSRSYRSSTAFGWLASRRTSAMALDSAVFPEPGVRVGPAPRCKARHQCSDGHKKLEPIPRPCHLLGRLSEGPVSGTAGMPQADRLAGNLADLVVARPLPHLGCAWVATMSAIAAAMTVDASTTP
jgi:hypothetical protein